MTAERSTEELTWTPTTKLPFIHTSTHSALSTQPFLLSDAVISDRLKLISPHISPWHLLVLFWQMGMRSFLVSVFFTSVLSSFFTLKERSCSTLNQLNIHSAVFSERSVKWCSRKRKHFRINYWSEFQLIRKQKNSVIVSSSARQNGDIM